MGRKKREPRVPVWKKELPPGVLRIDATETARPEPQGPVKRRRIPWKIVVFVLAACCLTFGAISAWRRIDWLHLAEQARRVVPLVGNCSPPLLPSLLFVGIVVILLLWKLPVLQVARSKGITDEKRFDRENEARKTLAQILAGVFVLAGLYSSVQTLNLSREGQITDRFTKAIEQLAAVESGGAVDADNKPKMKLEARLGGIYALERIARDSPRDEWTIMEVLTSYVRNNSPALPVSKRQRSCPTLKQLTTPYITMDIQAILTVIGRRDIAYDPHDRRIDLSATYLGGANLEGAHFEKANFERADLNGANLSQAHFEGANLGDVILTFSYLKEAHFERADLRLTCFQVSRHLALSGAHLEEASLYGADLTGANFEGAHLDRTVFDAAHLVRTDFSGAFGLTPKQVEATYRDEETKLPF